MHVKRTERVQHKFSMWLCGRCRISNVSFEYTELLRYFGLTSFAARRVQHDLMFMRNIQNQSVDSSFLLGCFPLTVPTPHSAKTLTVPCPTWTSEHCAIRDVLQTAAVMQRVFRCMS